MARPSRDLRKPPARPTRSRTAKPRGLKAEELLTYARGVLAAEADAILGLRERMGRPLLDALELMLECPGHIVVTGIGKSGFIAQKLSATLASTGVPSLYLHPAEAVHGDLGRVSREDVVLAFSNSGTTEEIVRLLPALKRIGARVVAITGGESSPLAKAAEVVLSIGKIDEACPMGLVPTASTAAMHAVGDALAMTLLKCRQFTSEEYALFHPGGKLGRSVMRVFEVMRSGEANPVVHETARLSEV